MANLKGSINFGLVHIPVEIVTAVQPKEISFRMLDSKDHSRIRFKRINETTGKEVEWNDIVKAYEYSPGEYVTVSEPELKELAAEGNRSIDIRQFIDREEVPPTYFETPYYLVPGKGGERAYVVLERALTKTRKLAVVQATLRNKEHLGVVFAEQGALALGLLRYPAELKSPVDVLPDAVREVQVTDKETAMAERLVKEMTAKFKPAEFTDRYAERLEALVARKVSGAGKSKRPAAATAKAADSKVVDIMELLKKSMETTAAKPKQKKRA